MGARNFFLAGLAAASVAAAACSGGRTTIPTFTPNAFPALPAVDTHAASLTERVTITATAAFTSPQAVVAVPRFLQPTIEVTNRSDEMLEGTLFVSDASGAIWQILDDGAAGAANEVSLYFTVSGATPRGLAIDQYEPKATTRIGRLWVGAGDTLRVLSGRTAPGSQIASITLSAAVLPAGEIGPLAAAPFGVTLFGASTDTAAPVVFRVDVADSPAQSAVTRFADLAPGGRVVGLAVAPDGALFVARDDGTFEKIPDALEATTPQTAFAFPVTVTNTGLAAPVGIGVNAAGNLIVGDASGDIFEFDGTTGVQIGAAVATTFEFSAFFLDSFLARAVFVTLPGGTTTVASQVNRSLAGAIQPIFTNRCVACHASGFASAGLVLEKGKSFAQTVNVPACEGQPEGSCSLLVSTCDACPGGASPIGPIDRVEPGDPAASYLVKKIEAAPDPGNEECALAPDVCGEPMPQRTIIPVALRRTEIEMIKAWVRAGAAND
jgi:hypothetical protein